MTIIDPQNWLKPPVACARRNAARSLAEALGQRQIKADTLPSGSLL
jgi:hypothetical protein